ncbi:MAG: queuosine precursor transporter [Caldilineaceae bacterium]
MSIASPENLPAITPDSPSSSSSASPSSASPASIPARVSPIIPRAVVIVIAAYIGAQMLADIASLKIGLVFLLAVDMGTFIYPITFTLRDVAHKVLGKRAVRTLVLMAALVNLFAALYLWWVRSVPSDPSWGLDSQWADVFNPTFLGRIVIASIIAEVVSELVDTEVYHWFVTRVTKRYQWARVLVSNSVSIPIDNAIFAIGAFWGILPPAVVWQIFLFNLVVKFAVTLVSLPLIYTTRDPETWEDQ